MTSTELEIAIESLARDSLQGAPARLQEAVLYSLLGPGKRIRPRLVLAVSGALGVEAKVAARIATGIEMIHAYTLVHDDLPAMDNDDLRRGRPTNHKVYGEGLAVLAGDSLALLGPDLFLGLRGSLPNDRVLALMGALLESAGARGVIAGQAAEMDLQAARTLPSRDTLYEVFRKKTGALFRASLEMPAIAAGARPELIQTLGSLGDNIGIVFQIADDLEDDFVAKKSDSGHLAAYLEADAARADALGRLALPPNFEPKLAAALAPFLDELKAKIAGRAR